MAEYTIDLSEDVFQKIVALARLRGVDANEIIKQAIATEKLIADHVGMRDELLIKSGDSFQALSFANPGE